jgi:hypothetical protein
LSYESDLPEIPVKEQVPNRVCWLNTFLIVLLLILFCSPSASVADVLSGLVVRYAFDSNGGTNVIDSSGNGYNGYCNGGTWTSGGKLGGGMSLPTTNEYMSAPVDSVWTLETNDNRTVAFWWKPDVLMADSSMCLVSKRDHSDSDRGLYFGYVPSRSCYYIAPQIGHCADYGVSVATGAWNHVVVVKEGINWKVYHNGQERTRTGSISWPYNGSMTKNLPLWIGPRDECLTGLGMFVSI